MRRERLTGFRDDLDQAAGGVESVVVAAIAIAEKHVAGHFARQLGVLFLHFGFDERVAGLVHDAVAAEFRDLVVHHLRAFHFADEGGAGLALQDLARVDEQQQIAVDDVAVFVDCADAVRVAVEGQAELGAGFADFGDQVREIGGDGGIGVMVREVAVHLEEQFGGVDVDLFKNAMDHRASRSVARVGDHFDAAIEVKLRRHFVHVGRDGVGGVERAAGRFRNRRSG